MSGRLIDDPEWRRERARLGGLALARKYPQREYAHRGLEAIARRYFDATDPTLPEDERLKKAAEDQLRDRREQAARARMAKLAKANRKLGSKPDSNPTSKGAGE